MAQNLIAAAGTLDSFQDLVTVMSRLREIDRRTTRDCLSPEERAFVEGLDASPYRRRGSLVDLWFRGQAVAERLLKPGAFRPDQLGEGQSQIFFEETSATFHFMLRRPEYRAQCSSDFEWLGLLQHYDGCTRLLDWSENAAVAAFFAVDASPDESGSLYVLNATLLNRRAGVVAHDVPDGSGVTISENYAGLCIDTSPDVVLRAAQALCRTDSEWRSRVEAVLRSGVVAEFRWLRAVLALLDEYVESRASMSDARRSMAELIYQKLTLPVAVFPRRSNARLVAQVGMFTIHGGKGRVETPRTDLIAPPTSMEDLAMEEPNRWLLRYEISPDGKHVIREQLRALGIHRATLFPEIQSDGEILRALWCR